MTPAPNDWHGVAVAKLTKVMGDEAGAALARAVLDEIGLAALGSSADLRRFADALSARGGFEGAVGGLLALHATMYDDGAARRGA